MLASIARKLNWELVAVLDDGLEVGFSPYYGARVAGPFSSFSQFEDGVAFCLGIGDNCIRTHFFTLLEKAGRNLPVLIDPSARLAEDQSLGTATVVMPGAILEAGVTCGRNCILNTGCYLEAGVTVGNNVHVAPGVRVGSQAYIADGAFLGIGSTVQSKMMVGRDVMIGAGAAVVSDIPEGKLAMGVPAVILDRKKPEQG